ncbi:unnamed protein product [Lasius platythorax]|uniref:Uncharacterized protein n=1 Tax=Lasius platythorax TaxID=488582 RepID=A0AAV2N4N4_9HYME
MKSHGRRENANGAGPRHVSGMYVIPIPLLSRVEMRTRKESPEPHPSHKNARIRMGEGEGENDLCGVICGRGVTPFSARFAPDPRAEDDGGDTGETEPEGMKSEHQPSTQAFDAFHYGNATSRVS